MVVAGARFCHYFTPTIRVLLIPEGGKFSNRFKPFLKIPSYNASLNKRSSLAEERAGSDD